MRKLIVLLPVVLLLLSLCPAAISQSNGASQTASTNGPLQQKMLLARSLYYTPTTSGLHTFHCNVAFDWKDYLARFSGKQIDDTNPALVYLNATHISVTDDLLNGGSLQWENNAAMPDALQSALGQIHTGMQQIWQGYFQTWNQFMNGSMIVAPDSKTTLAQSGDNLNLHNVDSGAVTDEVYDKDMLLTHVHVVDSESDATMDPVYQRTPDGLLLSSLHTVLQTPPSGPATDITIAMQYSRVGQYQLPASMKLTMVNVGYFVFGLNGCVVNP